MICVVGLQYELSFHSLSHNCIDDVVHTRHIQVQRTCVQVLDADHTDTLDRQLKLFASLEQRLPSHKFLLLLECESHEGHIQ